MFETNLIIEKVLEEHKGIIKGDYNTYKNHVYRVYSLCLKLDTTGLNNDKYAIAAVFHDLGIWTHHTFDYIRPSIETAADYLEKMDKPQWKSEISTMIATHHKISGYSGPYLKTVENFRRADWIDVTKGILKFGLAKGEIAEVQIQFPFRGFHKFLLNQTTNYFFKHPLRPLPMFKI